MRVHTPHGEALDSHDNFYHEFRLKERGTWRRFLPASASRPPRFAPRMLSRIQSVDCYEFHHHRNIRALCVTLPRGATHATSDKLEAHCLRPDCRGGIVPF